MNYQRISILGCGWLGFPLGRELLNNNHFVRGSTATKEKIPLLEEAGIEPYYLRLDPRISGDDVISFFDVDSVVLNIPPPRVEDRTTFMLQQGEELLSYINSSPVKRLVMVSSTGVYGSRNQDADENDPHPPETENGKGLLAMEQQLTEGLQSSVAVVRMAGLIGPERHPGRFLSERSSRGKSSGGTDKSGAHKNSGKSGNEKFLNNSSADDNSGRGSIGESGGISGSSHKGKISGNGEEPVNLIHLEDAIGVIIALLQQPDITGIFNACSLEHPTRKEFYSRAAEKLGFELPVFTGNRPRPWKRIISEKLRRRTGYRFVFDNPIDALKKM